MAVPIFFQAININTVDTGGSFLIGQNFHCNVSAIRKQNNGNGELTGIVYVAGCLSYIFDSDWFNNPVAVPELTPFSAQTQAL